MQPSEQPGMLWLFIALTATVLYPDADPTSSSCPEPDHFTLFCTVCPLLFTLLVSFTGSSATDAANVD